jgi:hypothetical protein
VTAYGVLLPGLVKCSIHKLSFDSHISDSTAIYKENTIWIRPYNIAVALLSMHGLIDRKICQAIIKHMAAKIGISAHVSP